MSKRPVIFLAFADDKDEHLEMLKQEAKDIYRTLQPLHDSQYLEIYREESADIEDIFYQFNRYKDRVAIFHYGGHANGTHLRLEGQNANALGLAKMFGEQENLKLVVLNGCSTKNQVEKLLELGVPAVIATSVPVNDSMALEFAGQLYQSLANYSSIGQAFNKALAYLETKYGDTRGAKVYRSLDWEGEVDEQEIPWGLFINPEKPDSLDWKLPEHKKVSLPAGFGNSIKEDYKINEYIVTVLEAMAEYNKALYKEMEDEFGDPKDPREYPELIIKNFPWPIGSQLRILVANSDMMNKPGLPRLNQLVFTYVATTKFLAYILLSQLWDEDYAGNLKLGEDVRRTFDLLPENSDGYDFMGLIEQIRKIFEENKITSFIEEFEVLFKSLADQDDTFSAYQFLEDVRDRINKEDIEDSEYPQLCNECEFCLSAILKKVAFLARYRLVTVKDIEIFKPKHRDALFRMQMGVLNAFDKEFLREKARDTAIYTDSHSVLVVKNLREMDEYLNLSPFVIDKNAFAGKDIPNIFMYFCRNGSNYEYVTVNFNINKGDPDEADRLLTDDEQYVILKEQFQLFSGAQPVA